MYKQFNPNPRQLQTGDCVVRAICAATGLSWDDVYDGVVLQGKIMCMMPTTNEVWESYLLSLGFERQALPDMCPDCYTVADFACDHARGAFILGTGDHAVAVVNGSYMDTWDSGSRVPKYYFYKNRGKQHGISQLFRRLSQ